MYDINYSNLLSAEVLKMYLYDISILGVSHERLSQQISKLKQHQKQLGIEEKFNDSLYRGESTHIFNFKHYIVNLALTTIILPIILIILKPTRNMITKLATAYGVFKGFFLPYLFVCIAIPFIPYIYRKHVIKKNNLYLDEQKQIAKQEFDISEKDRLQKEYVQFEKIKKQLEILTQDDARIKEMLNKFYMQNILHKDYQDPRICGIMFQLFDTGRVHNLTEAMNLYEDLKWKSEMKSMLQSLINKVDELIDIQSNIEYYSRCIISNQAETHRILDGISMNSKRIAEDTKAIEMNSDVIRSNTDTILLLQELDFIRKN